MPAAPLYAYFGFSPAVFAIRCRLICADIFAMPSFFSADAAIFASFHAAAQLSKMPALCHCHSREVAE
jgi:hypothetical protein